MFNKSDYRKSLNTLVMSLNIKIEETAYQVQYFLYTYMGYPRPDRYEDNKREWKYYINLSGRYHSADTVMYVYNRYTDSEMILSVENINMYPEIRKELLEYSTMFLNLVKKYPKQESLIKSILLPVDIDYAINAKTGTILTYNKDYIDSNEYSLISRLQEFSYGFFSRWHIGRYAISDNLYLARIYSVLYPALLLEIENIRVSNIFTYEAHSYYISLFFKSHLDIDIELDILTPKVKMWLYKNLRYIERHTGKQSTFNIIVDKVLSDSNIGIGEINLIKEDSTRNDSPDLYSPSYTTGEILFKTKELNDKYLINKNKTYDISQVLKKELLLKENSNLDYDVTENDESPNINSSKHLTESTKIIEIDDKITLRSRTIPELQVLVDNWFNYAFTGRYNFTTDFKDTNTNLIYKINPKQGALMLLKIFLKLVNQEHRTLKEFKVSSILRYEQGLGQSISKLLLDREIVKPLVDAMYAKRPALPSSFLDMESMKDYLLKINNLNNYIWYGISNVENPVYATGLKRFQERLYIDRFLDLRIYGVDATIDDLLLAEGIDFTISDKYDYVATMKALVLLFTGLGFNTADEDTADIEKYIKLIKKITSYSLQIIYTPVTSSSIESPYTHENIIQLSRPLISATKVKFNPLEDFYGTFRSKEIKWEDGTENLDSLGDTEIIQCKHSGFGLNYLIDRNYEQSINKININMSKDFMCLDLYRSTVVSDAATIRDTYTEMRLEPISSMRNHMFDLHYSTLGIPEITDSKLDKANLNMSIDYDDLNTFTPDLGINAFNIDRQTVLSDSMLVMEIDRSERGDLLLGSTMINENDNIIDKTSINMSIGYESIELNNYIYPEDVFTLENAGATLIPSLTINDYFIEDKVIALDDLNILTMNTTDTKAKLMISDGGYTNTDEVVELGNSNVVNSYQTTINNTIRITDEE